MCAARELFEETGLLLGADGCQVGSDDVRRDVIDGRVPFQSLQPSWAHLADQLRPWSNWITPVSERRRFNTMFFLANVDPDVAAKASLLDQSGDGELIDLSWWTPSEALQAYSSWEVKMAPPQIYIMHELLHKETIDEVYRHIGRGHPIKPILPRIERLVRSVMGWMPCHADSAACAYGRCTHRVPSIRPSCCRATRSTTRRRTGTRWITSPGTVS